MSGDYNKGMGEATADYDPRYLAGILLFNARDFFEAHDVWEELWADCRGPEQRFYQGLIQAAVGLFHYGGGNVRGPAKLYRSSRAYMEPFGSPYLGLDSAAFWARMEALLRPGAGLPRPRPRPAPRRGPDSDDHPRPAAGAVARPAGVRARGREEQ